MESVILPLPACGLIGEWLCWDSAANVDSASSPKVYHSHLYRVRKPDAWLYPSLTSQEQAQEQAPSRAHHPKLALSEATTALWIPFSWFQPNHPFLQIMHPPAWLFFPCALHRILSEKCLILTKQTLYLPNSDITNYPCSILMRTGYLGLQVVCFPIRQCAIR